MEGGNYPVDKEGGRRQLRWLPASNQWVASEAVQVDRMLEVVPAAQNLQIGVDDCKAVCDGGQAQSC
jgi:hypothetical protein